MVKARCTACRGLTTHMAFAREDMPPGLAEGKCLQCDSWRILMTDATLAEPFFAPKPKRSKRD